MKRTSSQGHVGLWPAFSMLNHSCSPNASTLLLGDRLAVTATEDIDAGAEVRWLALAALTCGPALPACALPAFCCGCCGLCAGCRLLRMLQAVRWLALAALVTRGTISCGGTKQHCSARTGVLLPGDDPLAAIQARPINRRQMSLMQLTMACRSDCVK